MKMRTKLLVLPLLISSIFCSLNKVIELGAGISATSSVKLTQNFELDGDSKFIYYIYKFSSIPKGKMGLFNIEIEGAEPKGAMKNYDCLTLSSSVTEQNLVSSFEKKLAKMSPESSCLAAWTKEKSGLNALIKIDNKDELLFAIRFRNMKSKVKVSLRTANEQNAEDGEAMNLKFGGDGMKMYEIDLNDYYNKGYQRVEIDSESEGEYFYIYYISPLKAEPQFYLKSNHFSVATDKSAFRLKAQKAETLIITDRALSSSASRLSSITVTPIQTLTSDDVVFYNVTDVYEKNPKYKTLTFKVENSTRIVLAHVFPKTLEGSMASFNLDIKTLGAIKAFSGYRCVIFEATASQEEIEKLIASSEPYGGCYGEWAADEGEFNALINFNNTNLLGFAIAFDNENNVRGGVVVHIREENEHVYPENGRRVQKGDEPGLVPYILNLTEFYEEKVQQFLIFRYSKDNYIYVIHKNEEAPQELYAGNYILLKTDPASIEERYNGVSQMVLLIDSLDDNISEGKAEDFSYQIKLLA